MGELQWLSQLLLGSVFIVAGTVKLFHWSRFRTTMAALEMFPQWTLSPLAVSIVVAELGLGPAVFLGWRVTLTGALLLALLSGFSAVLAVYRWRGGEELICGCFADFENKKRTSMMILRNGLLLLAGLPLLLPRSVPTAVGTLDGWLLAATVVIGAPLLWRLLASITETLVWLKSGHAVKAG